MSGAFDFFTFTQLAVARWPRRLTDARRDVAFSTLHTSSSCRLDIHVGAEEVRRIVLLLKLGQPRKIDSKCCSARVTLAVPKLCPSRCAQGTGNPFGAHEARVAFGLCDSLSGPTCLFERPSVSMLTVCHFSPITACFHHNKNTVALPATPPLKTPAVRP